jgi:arylsulfatase A-like enzyme
VLAVAGAEPPPELQLDGVDVLPLLRGEAASVPTTRFWQWNRYEPVAQCNAAMRDGMWKLVHPALPEAMEVVPADLARDVQLKYLGTEPDGITVAPLPDRTIPPAPPPQLFDLATDPFELDDLAATQPARTASMVAALGSWFEEVELDRRRSV